jgi:hypothetical protein
LAAIFGEVWQKDGSLETKVTRLKDMKENNVDGDLYSLAIYFWLEFPV